MDLFRCKDFLENGYNGPIVLHGGSGKVKDSQDWQTLGHTCLLKAFQYKTRTLNGARKGVVCNRL